MTLEELRAEQVTDVQIKYLMLVARRAIKTQQPTVSAFRNAICLLQLNRKQRLLAARWYRRECRRQRRKLTYRLQIDTRNLFQRIPAYKVLA